MLNLQQQNFYESFLKMQMLPGWKMLEAPGFLALKAPTKLDFVNFVWALPTAAHIAKAKQFYGAQKFFWLHPLELDPAPLLATGFSLSYAEFAEMILDLSTYVAPPLPASSEIIKVTNDVQFSLWSDVAATVFSCSVPDIREFFLPFIETAHSVAYLGYHQDKAVATSLTYLGLNTAGIYAMAVLPEYRRRGFGQSLAGAALSLAHAAQKDQAVLYASTEGELLYKTMGFCVTQKYGEYSYGA